MSNQFVLVGALITLCCVALAPSGASAELTSVSQFLEYAKGKETEPAVAELAKLVADEPEQDPCSQQKADQVRDYHATYVADKDRRPPVEALDFFIAYGLKLSQVCRRQAIELLAEHKVNPGDFLNRFALKTLDKYTRGDAVLGKILVEPRDYQDLVVPKNMAKLMRIGDRTKRPQKVYLQSPIVPTLRELKDLCKRQFEPVYEELVLPLVALSKAGFNFDDKHGPTRTNELGKKIYQWYRITFLCEALDSFELINQTGGDKNSITIISSGEAEELRRTSPKLFGPEVATSGQSYDASLRTARLGDQMIAANDAPLRQAIRKYRAEPNSLVKLIKKVGRSVKNLVERGLVRVVFGRNTLIGGRHVATGRDLVRMLDEDLAEAERRSERSPRYRSQEDVNFQVNMITGAVFLVAISVISGIVVAALHWGAGVAG